MGPRPVRRAPHRMPRPRASRPPSSRSCPGASDGSRCRASPGAGSSGAWNSRSGRRSSPRGPRRRIIVEEALACLGRRYGAGGESGPSIVDVGTGSGCLAVCLAREFPAASMLATDISPAALSIAARNAQRHGVGDRVEFRTASLAQRRDRAGRADRVEPAVHSGRRHRRPASRGPRVGTAAGAGRRAGRPGRRSRAPRRGAGSARARRLAYHGVRLRTARPVWRASLRRSRLELVRVWTTSSRFRARSWRACRGVVSGSAQ